MIKNTQIARPLLALAAALVSIPLAAQETVIVSGKPVFQERVNFADLDLRQTKARLALARRVMHAAWTVCIAAEGEHSAGFALGDSADNCPNSTYDAARPQMTAAFRRAERGEQPTTTALIIAAPASTR